MNSLDGNFRFLKRTIFVLLTIFCELIAIPPETIPDDLYDAYTLNGQIPVISWYINGSSSNSTLYTYDQIENMVQQVKEGKTFYYGHTDTWLYAALDKYVDQIKGKKVAIMGSTVPVYESVVLAWEGFPTTIEYNKIVSEHPDVQVMTVDEYETNPILFDTILSISSYEHDGLGRYGDPLNPNGDLLAMAKTKKMLKKDGLLFLAVPISRDTIVWNAHRVYGKIRLPLLLAGWEIVDAFGFSPDNVNDGYDYYVRQPVFVLRPISE